jgi:hypothetical protein
MAFDQGHYAADNVEGELWQRHREGLPEAQPALEMAKQASRAVEHRHIRADQNLERVHGFPQSV